METCYNRPQTESKEQTVTVSIPQPVKKCERKKIQVMHACLALSKYGGGKLPCVLCKVVICYSF